jgi:pimeloyl-ACP methyl ester carboxylesterase
MNATQTAATPETELTTWPMILDLSPLLSDKSKITKPQGCSRYRARVLSTKLRMLAVMLVTLGLLVGCTTTTGGRGAEGTGPAPTPVPTGGTAQSGSAPGSLPKFSDCSRLLDLGRIPKDRRRKLTVECARLQVPVDYAKPTGATISIALLRIHYADQPQRIGSLLVNPGGPGGSGVNLAVSLAGSVSTDVLRHFDIVGFDPRGVGLSTPVKCLSTSQEDRLLALDTDVRTAAGLRAAKQVYADFAAACNATYGSAIARYDTVDTARDMDRIRAALGEATMNYLGFSYGTELGAVYAHLFPNSIRAAALDGAVDPKSDDLVSWTRVQTSGFEQAFDQFASDCVTKDPCRQLGNPRQAVYAIRDRAATNPIPSSDRRDPRRATASLVLNGVLQALYSRELWPALATALLEARNGDARGLLSLADEYSGRDESGQYSNLLDVYFAVTCNDLANDPGDTTIQAMGRAWAKQYPMFGLWTAASLAQCVAWQKQRTPIPPETASRSAPILVVGNLHDPATPYAGAVNLTKELGSAALMSWNGQGHTSYLEGSTCVDRAVDSYLISRTLPSPNTTCPAR